MPNALPVEAVRNASPAAQASPVHGAKTARPTPEAFVKFEAMVLQTFMQSILPKESEAVYGGGMAGDMWKSLLAQQLGEVMARRGGIGIADRVLGDHYLEGEQKVAVAGLSRDAAEEAGRQDLLSTALVEKMQREIVKTLTDDLPGTAGSERWTVKPEARPR